MQTDTCLYDISPSLFIMSITEYMRAINSSIDIWESGYLLKFICFYGILLKLA
jgi:hypothetical protein